MLLQFANSIPLPPYYLLLVRLVMGNKGHVLCCFDQVSVLGSHRGSRWGVSPSQCFRPSCSSSSGPSRYFCPCSYTGSHLPTPSSILVPYLSCNRFSLVAFLTMHINTFFFFFSRGDRGEGSRWSFVLLHCCFPHPGLHLEARFLRTVTIFWCRKGLPGGAVEKEPATGYKIPTYHRSSGAPLSLASLHQFINYSSPIILRGFCCVCLREERTCVPSFPAGLPLLGF